MHTSIKDNWLNLEKGIPLLIATLAILITPWDTNCVFAMATLKTAISIIVLTCICGMFKISHRNFAIILVLLGITEICQYNHILYTNSTTTLKDNNETELTHVRSTKYNPQRIASYAGEYFSKQRALYGITGDYLQTDFAPSLRQDIVSAGVQKLMLARAQQINPLDFPYAIFGEQAYQRNNAFGYHRYDYLLGKALGFNTSKILLTNNVSITTSEDEAYRLTKNTNISAKPVITVHKPKKFINTTFIPLYTVTNTYFNSNKHKFLVHNFNDVALWLIYADANNPNWHAYIDGVPTEIYPANLAFKAIQVPPGNHEVYFQFSKATIIHKMFFIMQIIIGFMLACLLLSYPFIVKYLNNK